MALAFPEEVSAGYTRNQKLTLNTQGCQRHVLMRMCTGKALPFKREELSSISSSHIKMSWHWGQKQEDSSKPLSGPVSKE